MRTLNLALVFLALIAAMTTAAVLPEAAEASEAANAAGAAGAASEGTFIDEAQSLSRRDALSASGSPSASLLDSNPAADSASNSTQDGSVFSATNSIWCSSPSTIWSPTTISTNPFGMSYSNYQSCVWYIVAPAGHVPRLSFSSFNTEQNFDFVTVYNGYSTSSNLQVLRASGSSLPAAVTATSQYMTVQFTTDGSVTRSGVVASVSFVAVGVCSSPTFISAAGTIINSNPVMASYANGQACTWYISAPAGYLPRLTFSRFDTESGFDFVTVYNGPSTSYSQLLRTSGSNLPAPVTATQSYMTVTFNADSSVVLSGVIATVSFDQAGACSSPAYITTSGTMINTNAGSSLYANGQSCTWTIVAPYGYRPRLVFSSFNTEMSYDWFSVYDGSSTASWTLMRRSGSGLPASALTASQQYMTVTFTSDGSVTQSGVVAQVVFV